VKIALDLDGVVSDFVGGMCAFLKTRGIDVDPKDVTAWNWWECPNINITKDQWDEAFRIYWDANLFTCQSNYPDAVTAIQQLVDADHDVRFFTVRPEQPTNRVQLSGTDIICPVTYCAAPGQKARRVAEWGADLFVDDMPGAFKAAVACGVPSMLFERPWNEDYCKENRIQWTGGWDMVLQIAGCKGGSASKPQHRGHPRFYELLGEMRDIHDHKNHDYAGDGDPLRNFRQCERWGLPAWKGALVRLQDKVSRLEAFARQGELAVADETVADTLVDLANYALLTRILFEEAARRENEGDDD